MKQNWTIYLLYLLIFALSYFSPILGVVMFAFCLVRKKQQKLGKIALLGAASALLLYSIDAVFQLI